MNRRTGVAVVLVGALVLLLSVPPLTAESVDEVIDEHVAARGRSRFASRA